MIYCLDTDILIEYFRGNEAVKKRLSALRDDDSVGLTWLCVYEFFKGIFASGKIEEESFLNALVNSSLMLEETYESARISGQIYAELRKSGELQACRLVCQQGFLNDR